MLTLDGINSYSTFIVQSELIYNYTSTVILANTLMNLCYYSTLIPNYILPLNLPSLVLCTSVPVYHISNNTNNSDTELLYPEQGHDSKPNWVVTDSVCSVPSWIHYFGF